MSDLRSHLIQLAHENPELRAELVPLIRQGSIKTADLAGQLESMYLAAHALAEKRRKELEAAKLDIRVGWARSEDVSRLLNDLPDLERAWRAQQKIADILFDRFIEASGVGKTAKTAAASANITIPVSVQEDTFEMRFEYDGQTHAVRGKLEPTDGQGGYKFWGFQSGRDWEKVKNHMLYVCYDAFLKLKPRD